MYMNDCRKKHISFDKYTNSGSLNKKVCVLILVKNHKQYGDREGMGSGALRRGEGEGGRGEGEEEERGRKGDGWEGRGWVGWGREVGKKEGGWGWEGRG